jgi:hypothetical protein
MGGTTAPPTRRLSVSAKVKSRTALIVAIAVLVVAGIAGGTLAFGRDGGRPGRAAAPGNEDGSGGGAPGNPGTGAVPGDPGTGGGAANVCLPVNPDDPEGTVSSDCNDTPGTDVPGGPQIVEPTPGMADVFARGFDSATVGDDDRTVTVDFVSGIEPCSVLDHVDVAYGANAVTITLFEGHDASAGDVACIEIGVFKRVIVMLDQPLAGRDLVDGAAS